jgi:hypothetical protein
MSLFLVGDIHGRMTEYLNLLDRLRRAQDQSPSVICILADQELSFGGFRVALRAFSYQQRILNRRDEVSLLGGDGNIPTVRRFFSTRKNLMSRAGHKSLLFFCAPLF